MSLTRRQILSASIGVTTMGVLASQSKGDQPATGHVALLGDSIFDNKVYVAEDEPGVIDQLRTHLPDGWRATLGAVDGNVTADVAQQIRHLPGDATHMVISVGGNDALRAEGVLSRPASDVGQALLELAAMRDTFQRDYMAMLDAVLAMKKPAAVCTIYDPNFPDPTEQRIACTALSLFNDVITRAASHHGLPVIDLRVLFDSPEDYANPIEPSVIGGDKLARTIAAVVAGHVFLQRKCVIYSGVRPT